MLNQPSSTRGYEIGKENAYYSDTNVSVLKWAKCEGGLSLATCKIVRKENENDFYGFCTMFTLFNNDVEAGTFYRLRNAKADALEYHINSIYEAAILAKELKDNPCKFVEQIEVEEKVLESTINQKEFPTEINSDNSDDFAMQFHKKQEQGLKLIELKSDLLKLKKRKACIVLDSKKQNLKHAIAASELHLSIINDKLVLHDLVDEVQSLGTLNRGLAKLRIKLNKIDLDNQDLTLTCESVCPWGKYKNTVLENVPPEWLFDLQYEYVGIEPDSPELKALLTYIEEYTDVISET